jgi:hypothetical protein
MTAETSLIGMTVRRICSAVILRLSPLKGAMNEVDRVDTIRSFYNLWKLYLILFSPCISYISKIFCASSWFLIFEIMEVNLSTHIKMKLNVKRTYVQVPLDT